MDSEVAITELISFLKPSSRENIRIAATEQILGLTASEDGKKLLQQRDDFIAALIQLMNEPNTRIKKNVIQSIINLSSDEESSIRLLSIADGSLAKGLLHLVMLHQPVELVEVSCMALSNLSRWKPCGKIIWQALQQNEDIGGLEKLITLTCQDNPSFDHLCLVLCNLSQHDDVRRELLKSEKNFFKQMLGSVAHSKSSFRRQGIVGAVKNCCFDTEYHDWLLGEDVDVLSTLALPLAGPEEFDDDINDKLPLDLQYLGDDKVREEVPEIRLMLLEAITQLCATKKGRCFVRDKNIYYILRELHKWEKSKRVSVTCENLVDILIGDEPQPGMDNLKEVEIPFELEKEFIKMDEALLKDDR